MGGSACWELSPAGLPRGIVARDGAGDEVAHVARDGVLERRGLPALTVQREGLLSGERALLEGERELVRLRPRTWRRGIEVRAGERGSTTSSWRSCWSAPA